MFTQSQGNSGLSTSWAQMKEYEKSKTTSHLVLEISQFKVIFPSHKDATIFVILSLVPRGQV